MKLAVNGKSVYVYTGTRPYNAAQPNLLMLHGAANAHSVWALQSRYFAHHGWNVFAIDFPAHGQSEGPALSSIEAMSDWLESLRAALSIERFTLAGHSMGSLVALHYTATHSDRVQALALIGTAAPMRVSDALLEAAAQDTPRAIRMIVQWSHAPGTHLGRSRIPASYVPAVSARLMQRAAPSVLHNDLAACAAFRDALAHAAKIRVPTQLILGEADAMTPPRAAAKLAASLPQAAVETLAGCGHTIMSERPTETLAVLKRFLGAAFVPASR